MPGIKTSVRIRREVIIFMNFLYFTAIALKNCLFYHPVSLPYCNFWRGLKGRGKALGGRLRCWTAGALSALG